jgi:hypothetical protein
MNGTEQVRPSSWYYLLALLFYAGGIGMMAYFLVVDVHRIRDAMVRMDVPGEMDLDLKHRETYTVFMEHAAAFSTAGASKVDVQHPVVSCEVHLLPTGEKIEGKQAASTSTYSYGGRKGISVLEFEVPHDGSYTVKCEGPTDIAGQKVQVAIGGGASKALTAVMGRSFLVLVGGIVVGTLIFIRVAMLRLQSRKEIREQGLRPV